MTHMLGIRLMAKKMIDETFLMSIWYANPLITFFLQKKKQNIFHLFRLKHVVTIMVIFLTSIKLCFVQFSNF